MLRIAMLSVHTCPLATLGGKETGGMNVYVRELSRELGHRGFFVDVFTRAQDPEIVDIRPIGENARVVHLPAGPLVPYPKNQVYKHLGEFVDNALLFAQAEGIAYDLLHSHYWLSGLAALRLQEVWRVPIVQMFHTLGQLKTRAGNGLREHPLRIEKEREIMTAVQRIVAATPREKADMVRLYGADPKKILIVPAGVDLSRFWPIPKGEAKKFIGIPPEDKVVLFVGRIDPIKGIDILLRAMAVVGRERPELRRRLHLAIVGGNPDEHGEEVDEEMARLKELCANLGLKDLAVFLGVRDQDTLPYYYSAAEACVVPSHYESFGMVALEALACGTPVIASRVGGLTTTVKDGKTGYLVLNGDHRALAQRLIVLLEEDEQRKQMGREGRKAAQTYAWPLIADQIIAIYNALVAEPVALAS